VLSSNDKYKKKLAFFIWEMFSYHLCIVLFFVSYFFSTKTPFVFFSIYFFAIKLTDTNCYLKQQLRNMAQSARKTAEVYYTTKPHFISKIIRGDNGVMILFCSFCLNQILSYLCRVIDLSSIFVVC